jgi:glycosyltransferase involved in cell wall biosynthesis
MRTTTVAPPRLSIAICTWNRSALLLQTLESVADSIRASGTNVEVVVVDNNSSDSTAEVSERFVRDGSIRYFHESTAGLSNARNRAVGECRGEWVLFLDDDVRLDRTFISNYLIALEVHSDFDFFGGPIIPWFEGEKRRWTESVLLQFPWCYSCLDLGAPSRPLLDHQTPFGANMCIRRSLLEIHRFSSELGYRHGELIPGEETELFHRLREAGAKGFWITECGLLHLLPKERNSPRYLLRRAYGQGCSAGIEYLKNRTSRTWAVRDLLWGMRNAIASLARMQSDAMSHLIRICINAGILWGPLFQRRPFRD